MIFGMNVIRRAVFWLQRFAIEAYKQITAPMISECQCRPNYFCLPFRLFGAYPILYFYRQTFCWPFYKFLNSSLL